MEQVEEVTPYQASEVYVRFLILDQDFCKTTGKVTIEKQNTCICMGTQNEKEGKMAHLLNIRLVKPERVFGNCIETCFLPARIIPQ